MNAKINKRHRVALWLSFLAESALCAPENKLGVVLWVLAAPLSLAVFRALPERALRPKRPSWLVTAAAALLGVFLAVCFFDRWTIVTPVQGLFWRLGLDIGFWMQALAIALLVLAVPFLLWSGGHLGAAAEALEARYGGKAAVLTLVTLEAVLLHYALQTSSQQPLFPAKGTYIVPALLLMLAILLALALVLGRFGRAMLVGSVLCTLWAAANHYVLLFHGSPLFVSELANTRTALNVISGYSFLPDRTLVEILLLLPVELALGKSALRMEKAAWPKISWKLTLSKLGGAAACAGALVLLFAGTYYLVSWSTHEALRDYGFLPCAIDDARRRSTPFIEPAGYDPDAEPEKVRTKVTDTKPDIILILNETFCDLADCMGLQEDTNGGYLRSFYNIPGAVYGHAVSPLVGGGTNNSEYELLTGNTSYLLTALAPFNYVPLSADHGSVVAYLRQQGYVTEAMHTGNALNYSRVDAYPALGFDFIRLGDHQYDDLGAYGIRWQLDRNLYRQMYDDYESIGDEPRFLYLLTYQNHGGWEQNDASYDRVHTTDDYGDLTDDVDEYLTSMQLSARAFRTLIEHFDMVDRPVIVCMVGDHAPSFVGDLPLDETQSAYRQEIAKRTVPYVIWSNFDADLSQCPEFTSMFGLMPQVLRAAGLPLPDDYQTILALNRVWPVFSSTGLCMDAKGDVTLYDAADPKYDLIRRYLSIEYRIATEK